MVQYIHTFLPFAQEQVLNYYALILENQFPRLQRIYLNLVYSSQAFQLAEQLALDGNWKNLHYKKNGLYLVQNIPDIPYQQMNMTLLGRKTQTTQIFKQEISFHTGRLGKREGLPNSRQSGELILRGDTNPPNVIRNSSNS